LLSGAAIRRTTFAGDIARGLAQSPESVASWLLSTQIDVRRPRAIWLCKTAEHGSIAPDRFSSCSWPPGTLTLVRWTNTDCRTADAARTPSDNELRYLKRCAAVRYAAQWNQKASREQRNFKNDGTAEEFDAIIWLPDIHPFSFLESRSLPG